MSLLIAFLFIPLLVVEGSDRCWIALWPPGRSFWLEFVHSVERVPVRERLVASADGKLVLKETRYSSYGAGLPSDGLLRSEELMVENRCVELAELVLRVSREVSPVLYIGRTRLELITFAGDGGRVRIRLVRPWQLLRSPR
ncbi:MAG: DUF1850 domain-containing protein [Candidatus Bipolaricaulota bacterium]|nr:DUF1850 domain-containing protein [Candidatus Bipolaricaulota bacterium]MDW8127147.1 DUF1850 domain-containing protein [Candidatus Bipolaricaulota bacterium]